MGWRQEARTPPQQSSTGGSTTTRPPSAWRARRCLPLSGDDTTVGGAAACFADLARPASSPCSLLGFPRPSGYVTSALRSVLPRQSTDSAPALEVRVGWR